MVMIIIMTVTKNPRLESESAPPGRDSDSDAGAWSGAARYEPESQGPHPGRGPPAGQAHWQAGISRGNA
jgi:hypothetical protein